MLREQGVPRLRGVVLVAVAALLVVLAGTASAQFVIKNADGTASIKLGIMLQGWADYLQDPVTEGYAQNLFLRRARFIAGGQIAKDVTFFFMTDNPNYGKAPKSLGTGFIIQDAFLEWKASDEFMLDGGLILIPFCRNCLQSAATLLTLDYGSFSFLNSAPTQSSIGRDTGFQAKGYLLDKHLEYRVGAFQGFREAGSRNAPRIAGRIQYNVFEVETAPFYTGTYLGKKKILAFGVGYDAEKDYGSYAGDVFLDLPVGKGNGFTFQADYIRWDGGATFASLAKQTDTFVETGFYHGGAKLMPFVRYENQKFADSKNEAKNQTKYQGGLGWYPSGHNFNIKAAYSRVEPKVGKKTNEFTLQFQAFYF